MGRIFEKRKTTMFARWARVSRQFAKLSKEIAIAVKTGGTHPEANPRLRRAIQAGRAINMPKDKIEGAIKRASGHDATGYQEIVYEGYGPHGVAVLVEAATDNPTRTVANVRTHFKTHGGSMGTTGSVAFQFRHIGVFRISAAGIDADQLELDLIDHGLEEMREGVGDHDEPELVIRCGFGDLGNLQRALEGRGIEPVSAHAEYECTAPVELPEAHVQEVHALVEALEEDEDVQRVFTALA
jgi:YebC/PmpR family DNA-binding regulatory protein